MTTILAATLALALAGPATASADRRDAPQTLPPAEPQDLTGVQPLIVNGAPASIRSVPWQVNVTSDVGTCGGVILNATRVITAAHCIFHPTTNVPRPVSSFTVRAGVSNLAAPASTDAPQSSLVTGVRVHPAYVPTGPFPKAGDVAVLNLATALNLTGPAARPIPLATATPGVGTPALLTGFGQQSPAAPPNGQLYALGTGVVDPLACGGAVNALVVCLASSTGSSCSGDSGGPMTVGAPAVLAGISSFGAGEPKCQVGSLNGYTNVAAPENSAFILGSDTPPLAPRGGTDVTASGVLRVGGTLTCSPGTWTNGPTFAFAFVDNANGAVLQGGPSASYVFGAADLGRSVACHVSATNAGGTGTGRTAASPPIGKAARPPSPRLVFSARTPKRAIPSGGPMRVTIRIRNRGPVIARRVVVCETVSRGMSFARVPKGAKRSGRKVCWRVKRIRVGRRVVARVTVRTPRTARRAKTVVSVRAERVPTRRVTIRLTPR